VEALRPQSTRALPSIDERRPLRTALAAGCPIAGVDGLVLRAIDGARSVEEIGEHLRISRAEVEAIVLRLVDLGAVVLDGLGPDGVDLGWDAASGPVPVAAPLPTRPVPDDSPDE
jgi:hypothetical protein